MFLQNYVVIEKNCFVIKIGTKQFSCFVEEYLPREANYYEIFVLNYSDSIYR